MQRDILDEQDSLRGPFVQSILLHVGVAALLLVSGLQYERSHEYFGSASTQNGSAVQVNAVKSIPLPSRAGPLNPVANPSESVVPQAPKPEPKKQVKVPEKAIPLKSRLAKEQPKHQVTQRFRPPEPLPANQVLSNVPQAAISPMFEKSGTGGVGVAPNNVFGNRFGAYADLVIRRVTEKWQTNGLAGLRTAPVVVITFDILRDGSVRNAKVAQSSGVSALDYSALRAVMDAGQFPPLPQGFDRSEAGVELQFQLQR